MPLQRRLMLLLCLRKTPFQGLSPKETKQSTKSTTLAWCQNPSSNYWGTSWWKTPATLRKQTKCYDILYLHSPKPFWPYLLCFCPCYWGFLRNPAVALSVGSCIVPRLSIYVNSHNLLETLDSEPVPRDTIWNKWSPSITLRVTLVGKTLGREISAKALLNSGAEGIIIDHKFVRRHNLTLWTLVHPIPVGNVDGTPNRQGTVKHTTI